MRFIGSAPMDKPPLGPWLKDYQSHFEHLELPGEPYSYSIYLGDYHAPLSGYYLLGICAMAILLWQRTRLRRYAVMAGCTLTWTVLANTWSIPLQGIGVGAWLLVNHRDWRRLLPSVAGGAAVIWMAAWVYLSEFTASAAGYGAALRPVPWNEHSPPLLFFLFMLPTIALIALGLVSGSRQGRLLGMLWLSFLLFSEYFYIDDIYSGLYDRFNTTLKWWPWIAAGTLMSLGPFVLEQARKRWVRVAGLVFCVYPCFYVLDLSKFFLAGPRKSIGQMEGTTFLTKDEFPRLMLGRMKVEKPGVVVERPDKEGGFTNSAVIPLFAGQTMWLGWYGHELLWREFREDVRRRHDALLRRRDARRRQVALVAGDRLRALVPGGRHPRIVGQGEQVGQPAVPVGGHPHLPGPPRGWAPRGVLEAGPDPRALTLRASRRGASRTCGGPLRPPGPC
jgi:hypothetical protein